MKQKFLALILFSSIFANAQKLDENLFKNSPNEYKPRTWMHAMSGNMSKEGLTKDLKAIQKVGIGGFLLFNVTQAIPKGKIKYNSKEHHQMLSHAALECERLGLSFGVHNCDGWTSSGSPWNTTPENAMKMLIWREVMVEGSIKRTFALPKPNTQLNYYKDVAIVSYLALATEIEDNSQKKAIFTTSKEIFDILLQISSKHSQNEYLYS